MTQGALFCIVCGSPEATMSTKALNGLPCGVTVCQDCTEAVKRRQVGISRWADGTLSITDGRKDICASAVA